MRAGPLPRRCARTAATLLLAVPLLACAADGSLGGLSGNDDTVTVLAAASLTESFTELAEVFEQQHPGTEVELSFGSSTTLAQQAVDGAPGDVLATADERAVRLAVDGGVVTGEPRVFATNTLALVTPPDDPAGVEELADLDRPDVELVTCVPTAPCGALAAELLRERGVDARAVSEEVDVKAVLSRVSSGEADAGIVYRTDARAAGEDVSTVPLRAGGVATAYPIATLTDGDLAQEFVDLVLGPRGRAVLADAGFGPPPGRSAPESP